MDGLAISSMAAFVLGAIPLLALAFFSPGMNHEGYWAYAMFIIGATTLLGLVISARRRKWMWGLVLLQLTLLTLVLYETFSDAALYSGT
ncbi:MAG TPA: hypothetical protein VMH34_03980 [Gammaproteobacteria bacterium]|nr:hypothetical protein [Gammaproteobacteria bacterium]